MRKLTYILVMSAIAAIAAAQETKTEKTSPAAVTDSMTNIDAVPDVCTMGGRFERVLILRLKYKTDLLAGIEKGIRESGVLNGVILAGTGSVMSYHYHVVSNMNFPTKDIFIRNPSAPADLVGMNGYVINGRVHAHASFTDAEKAFGGHLEPGTTVFTFAIITVGVLSDTTDLNRTDDKNYR